MGTYTVVLTAIFTSSIVLLLFKILHYKQRYENRLTYESISQTNRQFIVDCKNHNISIPEIARKLNTDKDTVKRILSEQIHS